MSAYPVSPNAIACSESAAAIGGASGVSISATQSGSTSSG